MEIKDTLIIAKEFGDTAGARDYEDGDFSGKEFYDKLLEKRFLKARDNMYILLIDIDGFWGWPSSFVSGSFGLLSMEYGSESVLKHLQFKSEKNPLKITKAIYEIENPTSK
tara:strand:+ start:214 stop:546 length:333 start_codon:yes stop_codon:yes gene_type:complete